ncbi:MAG TPA: hypothetical protein VH592_10880 [Gemmataceae bacterium]|jgi:hypothetical protein
MRYDLVTSSCTLLFLLLAGTASAEDARAILDRAIQAHGGAAGLERTKKGHLKGKCEGIQANVPFEYEIEEWFDLPVRNKRIYDGNGNNTSTHVEWLFMGKESWMREGNKRVQYSFLPISQSAEQQQWYAVLAMLLLLRENDAQLTSLPEETKDGRTLAVIHAVYSQLEGDYFFDKSTGLLRLTKAIRPVQETIVEHVYDDYRDVQGTHYPMRIHVTEKTYSSTFSISSIEFLDKIDEAVFAKPQAPAAEGTVEETVVRKTTSQPTADSSGKAPEQRNQVLIVVTIVAGVIIGAVWFMVRASRRGKQELPPS